MKRANVAKKTKENGLSMSVEVEKTTTWVDLLALEMR